jgi:uncharacterized SAM-binding protein YcdF (DUF218 family)
MKLILRGLFTLAMTFATILVIWGLGYIWFASAIAFGSQNDQTPEAEAIVVLTGGNGRINDALDLLNDKIAPTLFVSGVNKGVTKNDIYNSWENKTDEKPCCVVLGYQAVDTSGNAKEVQEWVNDQSIESFVLVTSRYHMPRAYMQISNMLPETQIHKYVTDSEKDYEPWQGRFWSLTFSEYNKMLIEWLRLQGRG